MTQRRIEDLSSHDENVFSIKQPLPLFPAFGMAIDFRTHSFDMCNSIRLNNISLLEYKMHQRNNKNSDPFLFISDLTSQESDLLPRNAIKSFLH
jgi:hypothetical protein